MKFVEILYYFFMLSAAVSAASILFIENLFRAVLLLLIVLLSIAGIYVMSFAEFLAVTQILIYAGGVVVIILFGIMLTSKTSGIAMKVKNTNIFSAALLGCLLMYLLITLLTKDFSDAETNSVDFNSVRETGIKLMTSHLLAFEVAAILLLVTLIGAAVISSGNKNSMARK